MALAWKPFHHTASLTAREDGRGYYIHKVGGLFQVVLVKVNVVELGTFADLARAKARAEQDLISARRIAADMAVARLAKDGR